MTTPERERVENLLQSRATMLALFDEAGYPDLGTAIDEYLIDLVRLYGDDLKVLVENGSAAHEIQ